MQRGGGVDHIVCLSVFALALCRLLGILLPRSGCEWSASMPRRLSGRNLRKRTKSRPGGGERGIVLGRAGRAGRSRTVTCTLVQPGNRITLHGDGSMRK